MSGLDAAADYPRDYDRDRYRERVRTWDHARKGRIRGVIIEDTGEWLNIALVGDQTVGYVSRTIDPHHDDGDVLTVRKSLLTEVTDA